MWMATRCRSPRPRSRRAPPSYARTTHPPRRGATTPPTAPFTLSLKPTADQTGEFPITFTASDGQSSVTQAVTLEIEEEWEVYSLPGVQGLSYWPRQSAGHRRLPGRVRGVPRRRLGDTAITSTAPAMGASTSTSTCCSHSPATAATCTRTRSVATLTIERNPSRRFLLPYFGAEVGGIHSAALGDYFIVVLPSTRRLHLWADRSLVGERLRRLRAARPQPRPAQRRVGQGGPSTSASGNCFVESGDGRAALRRRAAPLRRPGQGHRPGAPPRPTRCACSRGHGWPHPAEVLLGAGGRPTPRSRLSTGRPAPSPSCASATPPGRTTRSSWTTAR